MPRQPRIDIPGLLQHVMVRGIERSDIFLDDDDRRNFLRRLSALLQNKNSLARVLFCYLATRELGYSGTETGSVLRMGNSSVTRAARRGEALFAGESEIRRWWQDLLKH